jgi:hypothetical protein
VVILVEFDGQWATSLFVSMCPRASVVGPADGCATCSMVMIHEIDNFIKFKLLVVLLSARFDLLWICSISQDFSTFLLIHPMWFLT